LFKLECEHFAYDHQTLFANFDLQLKLQAWHVILGPSGIGKSTILQIFAGLVTGKFSVTGAGSIAYMAQKDGLMPWLNVLDNTLIGYRLRHNKTLQIKTKALSLLGDVGLASAINKYPHELSGGMRQRVALVRTLLEECDFVLMDEPFSALDALNRIKLQDLAAELLAEKTVVMVTHDPLEAVRLADFIYILAGSPAEVIKKQQVTLARPRLLTDANLMQLQGDIFTMVSSVYAV